MANKQSKITSKQATIISLLIALIYAIILTIIVETFCSPNKISVLVYFGLNFFLAFTISYFIDFEVPDRKREEHRNEIKLRNIQRLSSTSFKQVYFNPEYNGVNTDIMLTILEKDGCVFYAKLVENNCIYLIIKDKNNEEVFNEKIGNHLYFALNFKFMP